jgi:hypothetical protein
MHGEDECTRVEDHPPWDAVAASPGMNPSYLDIPHTAVPVLVQPLPRRPKATPAPEYLEPDELDDDEETGYRQAAPPAPVQAAPVYAQPSPAQALYVPYMHAPMQRAAVVPAPLAMSPAPSPPFYSYAEACAQPVDTTTPVAPLPFAELATNSFPRQIPRWSKIAMPIGGAVAIAIFVTAFFTRDARPELPPISSVSRAETPTVVAAAAPAAPAELPADSHWKPRTVVPTTIAGAAPEIEVPAAAVTTPAPVAVPARTKPAPQRVAVQAPRADEAPVRAEIAKPARRVVAPRANGPGKAVVTSNTPSLVYIDGRPTGLKTPTTINLAPGPHKITLVAISSKSAKTVDLDIRSGTSVPVHREFAGASSAKGRQLQVDTSSPLGGLRPKKAW